jgi:hypothetical protein
MTPSDWQDIYSGCVLMALLGLILGFLALAARDRRAR